MQSRQPEIEGYELLEKIGIGVRSAVYRAKKKGSGQIVAIKYVRHENPEDNRYLGHLRNEYHTLLRIQRDNSDHKHSANIVVPYELRSVRSLLRSKAAYMVMEYIPGVTLHTEHDYPLPELIGLFIQVGEALEFVHRQEMVHGDVKLNNVIVRPDGIAKLIDFGFSCPRGTRRRGIRGTRHYMAPEQVQGGPITELTDIYNYGASLYRAITRQPLPALIPPDDNSRMTFISGIHIKPQSIHELRPEVPLALSNVIMECCERRPARRPSGIAMVLERLRRELHFL